MEIDFWKNFMLLNEEEVNFFNKNLFKNGNFLLGDNKLFLEEKDMIYIFKLVDNSKFDIEQILYLKSFRSST